MRIAQLIAQRGVCSRREAERRIQDGRVILNGERLLDPATNVDPDKDIVEVDGEALPRSKQPLYIALNKPRGVLSSFSKDREKGFTLGDVIPHQRRLFPAGRLDRDSTGLLILTTDGDWANRVMHPRYEKEKEYLVKVSGLRPTPAAKKMKEAYFWEEGKKHGADSVEADGSYLRIVLHEGRNRQIRRLAQAAGLEVRELIRVRIGEIQLGNLKPGKYRNLSSQEVKSLSGE
ncbi:rRNA pseudouridine synthase [bacterium]|nr:rRNA pseudouridine synthase [bacterium]